MKNKWIVALFILFLGVILLSILIAQESQKIVSMDKQETQLSETGQNLALLQDSPGIAQASPVALPLARRGITIISSPAAGPIEEKAAVFGKREKATNKISGVSSINTDTENYQLEQAGVTRDKKQPTTSQAKEMNSRGIILY
jgi:hypothetical protein